MVQSRRGLALVFVGALLLSAVWLVACWAYLRDYLGFENLGFLQPLEIATGITALIAPLIVVWMIALFLARAGSLRRETRALLGRLDGLTYADHAATERVGEITAQLRAQTELLAAATEASVGRVETLRQALAAETQRLAQLAEQDVAAASQRQAQLSQLLAEAARQQQQAAAAATSTVPALQAGGVTLANTTAALKQLSQQALAELNRGLAELQAGADRLAASGQASAQRLQGQAEGLLGLGQKLDDNSRAQAARLTEQVVLAEGKLTGFAGGLTQLGDAVQTLLRRLDLDLAERGQRLQSAASAETAALAAAAEQFRLAAAAASQSLADQGTQLTQRVQQEVATRATSLGSALEAPLRQLSEASSGAVTAARDIGQTLAGERRLLAESTLDTQTRVQALGKALAAGRQELQSVASAAEAAAGTVSRALQGETTALTAAAQGLTQALGQQGAQLAQHMAQLRGEAESALAKLAALQQQGNGKSRDGFLTSASALLEELNRATLDLHGLLGEEIPAEVWQRLQAGDRSIVARRLPRLKDRKGTLAIVKRYEKDPRFRGLADRFMTDFERLLAEAGTADPGHGLSAAFLTADVGRLYLVLARATGRSQ